MPSPSSGSGSSPITDNQFPTTISTLKRQTISQQTSVPATLGYAGSYRPVNQASGTYTALPAVGQVVSEGQVLYRVNGHPVVLLDGTVPAYRALSEGACGTGRDRAQCRPGRARLRHGQRSGPDLRCVQMVDKGRRGEAPDRLGGHPVRRAGFGADGVLAVERSGSRRCPPSWADRPRPASRCSREPRRSREVTIDLDAGQQSEVKVDDPVTITLPDSSTTPGVVSSVGTVATTPLFDLDRRRGQGPRRR